MDLRSQIEENRLCAFTCYVRDWKKQNPCTIKRCGTLFSYTTKSGIVKEFESVNNVRDATFRVQGFCFREITDKSNI